MYLRRLHTAYVGSSEPTHLRPTDHPGQTIAPKKRESIGRLRMRGEVSSFAAASDSIQSQQQRRPHPTSEEAAGAIEPSVERRQLRFGACRVEIGWKKRSEPRPEHEHETNRQQTQKSHVHTIRPLPVYIPQGSALRGLWLLPHQGRFFTILWTPTPKTMNV
jgi:hypothetical protein